MSSFRFVPYVVCWIVGIQLVNADDFCESRITQACMSRSKLMESTVSGDVETQCRSMDDYVNCMKDEGCGNTTEIHMYILSRDYYCKDHKKEYLEFASCLFSEDSKKLGQLCVDHGLSLQNVTECERMNWMFSCAMKAVGICCGEKARSLQEGYFKLARQLQANTACKFETNLDVNITLVCSSAADANIAQEYSYTVKPNVTKEYSYTVKPNITKEYTYTVIPNITEEYTYTVIPNITEEYSSAAGIHVGFLGKLFFLTLLLRRILGI